MFLRLKTIRGVLFAIALALTAVVPAAADEPAAPAATGADLLISILDRDDTPDVLQVSGPKQPETTSGFWIGITGNPIDDVLRSHLDLAETQGMLVTQVIADGPAARAGLKLNDVLLLVGDKPLKEVGDLAALIAENKDAKVAVRLVRAGKPIIVEVTPERRPPSQTGETCPTMSKLSDDEFVRRLWTDLIGKPADDEKVRQFADDKTEGKRDTLVSKLLRQSTVATKSCTTCHTADAETTRLYQLLLEPQVRLRYVQRRQGAVVNNNTLHYLHSGILRTAPTGGLYWGESRQSTVQPLPDDLTISITRKGKEPARINVRQGDNTWGATETDYQKTIPEALRGHVESTLRGQWLTSAIGVRPNSAVTSPLTPYFDFIAADNPTVLEPKVFQFDKKLLSTIPKAPPAADAFQRVDQQLESLNNQLAELRKAMQELQKALQGDKSKAGAAEKK
ncbi:MAG: PDZ domain-containing protein [Planctomycetaceae bacterium]|nr:PDZ domain-containing protein [Planctomycetaceae bacterium]